MNGIGAAYYAITPAQVSVRLLPAYCVALTTAMSVRRRHGPHRPRRAPCAAASDLILAGTALLALCMSAGPWVITASMCLIYAGFGALFTPIYDTVFATVAPGQNGRAVAMNDLAMQGSAAIGIGVFTPWLATGSFRGHRPRVRRRGRYRHRRGLGARIPLPPRPLSGSPARGRRTQAVSARPPRVVRASRSPAWARAALSAPRPGLVPTTGPAPAPREAPTPASRTPYSAAPRSARAPRLPSTPADSRPPPIRPRPRPARTSPAGATQSPRP